MKKQVKAGNVSVHMQEYSAMVCDQVQIAAIHVRFVHLGITLYFTFCTLSATVFLLAASELLVSMRYLRKQVSQQATVF